jgi:hypothetical protein
MITEPGIYTISADEYHAHRALSSSGARKLLPPSCPARFHHERGNPIQATPAMEFGSVAHDLLLGNGNAYEVLDYDNYRTKESQEKAKELRADGKIPILRHEYRVAEAMVSVVRHDPAAKHLFDPKRGKTEQSLFWTDKATGVALRARLDYLPDPGPSRMIIPDYKTCNSADLESIAKEIGKHGYHIQGAWYTEAVKALGLDPDPAYVLVWQEKQPPYLVTVTQMPVVSLLIGRDRMREAVELFAECERNNHWPPYSEQVEAVGVPSWMESNWRNGLS